MIEIGDDDPQRKYTPEEERTLTEHLKELTRAVHAGHLRDRRLDVQLLRDLHAGLFGDVRGHAGRIRDRGQGTEYLVFGPHRSEHRDRVAEKLREIFAKLERDLRSLGDVKAEDYELRAIELAIRVHAEIIRVHPFEDGNGRTGRLCMAHLLVRFGLRPIPVEAVKQEYTEALNHFYVRHDMDPLLDLFVALYPLEGT